MRGSFLGRGAAAFAAASMLTVGLVAGAGAQAAADDDDAVVVNPLPGYNAVFVGGVTDPVGVILTGATGPGFVGDVPLAVQFLPDFSGATIITPGADLINVSSDDD